MTRILIYFIILICFSCNKNKYVETYELPKLMPTIEEVDLVDVNNQIPFSWIVPNNWIEGAKSSMRLASFNAPYNNGLADISITNFSGDGGGLKANVNRWRKQLGLEPQSEEIINKSILIQNSKLGEYKFLKIINDSNIESAFLCSIIEIKNSIIFIKMKASIQGINELEKVFLEFCSSFK
tara:strand:+ start:2002 stop:2544 length:543 start_codon:yes stop_codon:yes gene_type:complete